jgi:AcrR family transcriptional regulator
MTSDSVGLRQRGKQRRAERILDAARELLRATPDQALTVERIAARAEVSAPTVFNLIGRREQLWSALADYGLRELDLRGLRAIDDPQERARAVVRAVIDMVCADGPVFRALLANWSDSARMVAHDPTGELLRCLKEAARDGAISSARNLRRRADLISAGLIGIVHQWGAGLISDVEARSRGRDLVDFAFAAARAVD